MSGCLISGRPTSVASHATERALCVLELLARRDAPVTASDIAESCAIPRSSVQPLLVRMRDRGFVEYNAERQGWELGVVVVELGSAYRRRRPPHRLGRTLLLELTERLGETSHLAVLDGADVVYIGKEQPSGAAPRLVTEVGTRLPAHRTAVGLAILAEMPDADVRARYDGAVPDDVASTRARGYATDEGMITPGITCVAAGVVDEDERPVAAIGVTFVTAHRAADEVREIAAAVRDASDRLSAALGSLR